MAKKPVASKSPKIRLQAMAPKGMPMNPMMGGPMPPPGMPPVGMPPKGMMPPKAGPKSKKKGKKGY